MDLKRTKHLAGLKEAADYGLQDMTAKLDKIAALRYTPATWNDQMKMIYQWVKTDHISANQFLQLVDYVQDRRSN